MPKKHDSTNPIVFRTLFVHFAVPVSSADEGVAAGEGGDQLLQPIVSSNLDVETVSNIDLNKKLDRCLQQLTLTTVSVTLCSNLPGPGKTLNKRTAPCLCFQLLS